MPDHKDNCPNNPNANQWDKDNDGVGNKCDTCPHLNGSTGEIGNGCPCDRERLEECRKRATAMRDEAKRLRSLADTYDTAETRSQLIALGAGVGGFIGTCICPGPGTAAGALGLTSLIGYITYEQGESEDECIERAEALENNVERLQGLASVWERGCSK